MQKAVLITNIPTPYRIPLFNELNKQMLQEGMELHVIFSESGYQRRKFEIDFTQIQFPFTILKGGTITSNKNVEKTYFFYKGLWNTLNQLQPKKIIVAGFSAASIITAYWCSRNKCSYSIWSGSIETETRNNSWFRIQLRKQLIKRAHSFIAYGSLAAKYLTTMGAPKEKVFIGINTVDTSFFAQESARNRDGLSNKSKFIFTYLGYLVPRKNISLVIEAAALLLKERSDFHVQIIGDGESKSQLEALSIQLGLHDHIEFIGYKQREEIPLYFAKTNALLFQSDFDIWGLVLNEAMAAGLCCLATIHAGATFDLIKEGQTGFTVDYVDQKMVVEKMKWMIDHPTEVEDIGNSAANYIHENANLSTSAKGFILALKK